VTRELAVVETEAVAIAGHEHEALWRFFPGAELEGDVSNWWAPNLTALTGALNAAGFPRVEVRQGPPASPSAGIERFRAVVHAYRR
jgi:hypothetical protein